MSAMRQDVCFLLAHNELLNELKLLIGLQTMTAAAPTSKSWSRYMLAALEPCLRIVYLMQCKQISVAQFILKACICRRICGLLDANRSVGKMFSRLSLIFKL